MGKREGKSEKPTDKKKRDARKKGTVAKSQDLGPWVTLLVASYLIPLLVRGVSESAVESLATMKVVAEQPDSQTAVALLGSAMKMGLFAVLPFLGVCALVGIVTQLGQTGLVMSLQPLKPDLKRLDPIAGTKKLFSVRSLWETAKQVTKGAIIAWLCWPKINVVAHQLIDRGRVPLWSGLAISGEAILGMVRTVSMAVVVIALIDFAYQKRSTLLDLKMTKQEVRDEMRSSEGDPMVKQRMRALRHALARNRMMREVAGATVVVTNPTHVAIALRYDGSGSAPRVVAAGVGSVAARIKERAIDAGVPVVEAKPLARALWRACEVGDEIPAALYEAVAMVLAFIRRLRGGLSGASVMSLPGRYQVETAALEAVTGSRRRRLLPA
ncbi:MAG: EscU/YscU/HrcU family type III secretion system export apparatus switch protein [Ilumatobacteraceae bacterium]|jgi:flagellar biosynthetic protein FlhB